MRTSLTTVIMLLLLAHPSSVGAHGGGVDGNGGHNDRKRGGYHFHSGPLAGRKFASKSAALAALRQARSPRPAPAASPKPPKDAQIIKKASTRKKIDALIALLIRKKLIAGGELALEISKLK